MFFFYKILCHLKRVMVSLLSKLDEFYLFIYLCLIALGRNSNTTLNKNVKSRHSYPVPRGKVFSFSALTVMLDVGLPYMVPNMLKYIFSIPTLLTVFYHKMMFNIVKTFFYIYWDDHIIFTLHFVNRVYHILWFIDVEPS